VKDKVIIGFIFFFVNIKSFHRGCRNKLHN
jgi:hypothetical protein